MLPPHRTMRTGVLLAALALGTALVQAETDSDPKQAAPPSETDVAALRARALETKDERVFAECAKALALIDSPQAADAMADILVARVVTLGVFPATRVVVAACRMTLKRVTVTPAERRRLVLLCQLYHKAGTPLWVALQQVKDTEGVFWRDKILAAGALAAHGDAKALDFLLRAYGETALLLPPVKQVQYEIRKTLCTVPDAKAATLLAAELQRMNDPPACLQCLGWMLRADNAQAIVLVRRLFPILKDDLDLLLIETLLRVLDRYGERRDLALLPVIGSEKMLAGVGPDRSRLEEAVQRTRARLLGAGEKAGREQASAIEALGVTEGKPINSGFVFIDGRYVEAPYRVSRRGRQVLINDIMVYQWPEWPLMDRHVKEDPGPPPKEYEALTSFADIIDSKEWLNSHLYRKRRYLYEHFPKEEADKRLMEYYRQCPFVASARLVPEEGPVRIVTKNGEAENINLGPPPPGTIGHWDFGAKDVLRELKDRRKPYESFLSLNKILFIFSDQQDAWFWPPDAKRDLRLMVEVLRSNRSEAEKMELLGRMEILPSPNAAKFLHPAFADLAAKSRGRYETLIRNFQPSAQLNERIAALVKKPGVKPRTLKDLPEEIPWDRMQRLAEEKRKKEQARPQNEVAP